VIVRLPALPKFYRDLGERVFWTAAQAGLAVVSVQALGIPVAYVPLVALVLSAAKGYVARKVGNPDSASTAKGV
jgi:hypothetical protein